MARELKIGAFPVIVEELVQTEQGLIWQPTEVKLEPELDVVLDEKKVEEEEKVVDKVPSVKKEVSNVVRGRPRRHK